MAGPIIALTTDFGSGSPYVAQMKGVLYSALPEVRVVDVVHDIPPQAVRHAEVIMRAAAFTFPLGTVHIVVVDPGVGTKRRGLAVQARGLTFVGPDNGVLGAAIGAPGSRAVVLDRSEFFRLPAAPTFHGRDIFAPVAAELAGGLSLEDVGSPIDNPLPSSLPQPVVEANRIAGETLIADTFGNLLTNIPGELVGQEWRVTVAGRLTERVHTYEQASRRSLLSLVGSDGYLEIALRGASAARELGAAEGLRIICEKE
jgi:S-adenosyl-L-methionine hydrolase (adenosine-forming)